MLCKSAPRVLPVQAVREAEHDAGELAQARLRQEQRIALATPFYDAARRSSSDDVESGQKARAAPIDYLSPFLPLNWHPDEDEPLSEEQAAAAREACMQVRCPCWRLCWTSPCIPIYLQFGRQKGPIICCMMRACPMNGDDVPFQSLRDRLAVRAGILRARRAEEAAELAKREVG
jgi:hypothetical protein